MRLFKISANIQDCWRSGCPGLYRSEDGRLFAQGPLTTDADLLTQTQPGIGEGLIEVHPAVVEALQRQG